jgi:hypothetical protein
MSNLLANDARQKINLKQSKEGGGEEKEEDEEGYLKLLDQMRRAEKTKS